MFDKRLSFIPLTILWISLFICIPSFKKSCSSNAFFLSSNIKWSNSCKFLDFVKLNKIYGYLVSEMDTMQVEKKIKGRVKRQMEKTQK